MAPAESSAKRPYSKIVKVVVSLGVILGAAAYLLGGSIGESLVYDRTVDEVLAEATDLSGNRIRVGGLLAAESLQPASSGAPHEFALVGTERNLIVHYRGVWPDAAIDGRELMVEGTMLNDGTVRADRVLARCPSRYKSRVSE